MFPYFCPFFITNAYFCFFLKRSAIQATGKILRIWPLALLRQGTAPNPLPTRIHKKKSQMRLEQSFFYYVIILSELHKVVASTLEVILKKPPNGCRQQGQNPFVKSTGGVAYGIYFKQH